MEFDKITHLDLGCGPAPLRIEDLLRQGVENCVGIDRDLGPENEDFMSMKWDWGIMKDEHPVEYAEWNMHEGPKVFMPAEVGNHLILGDAVNVLRLFGREQIHAVYADHFFHELKPWQSVVMREKMDKILRSDGVIIATQHEGEETDDVLDMFKGYDVLDMSYNYSLVTNDLVYWKAIEEINNRTTVQVILAKCATAAK